MVKQNKFLGVIYIADVLRAEVVLEMLPEQKLSWVEAQIGKGHKVAMGSGTVVARESANVILLGNDLVKFVETLQITKRCYRIIWANFIGTLVVDGIGLTLAALGYLNPIVAALIHVCSELVFILNSARLLPSVSRSVDPRNDDHVVPALS